MLALAACGLGPAGCMGDLLAAKVVLVALPYSSSGALAVSSSRVASHCGPLDFRRTIDVSQLLDVQEPMVSFLQQPIGATERLKLANRTVLVEMSVIFDIDAAYLELAGAGVAAVLMYQGCFAGASEPGDQPHNPARADTHLHIDLPRA